MTIDSVDRQILGIIQDDADRSTEMIAAQVNLSPSAVHRRISRLKRQRIIEKIGAILDPEKIGLTLTVLAKVQFESNRPACQDKFRRWVKTENSIQGCWHVAGEFDYFVVFVVRDLQHYNELSQRMMSSGLGLSRIESAVVFQTVKRGVALNLDLAVQQGTIRDSY